MFGFWRNVEETQRFHVRRQKPFSFSSICDDVPKCLSRILLDVQQNRHVFHCTGGKSLKGKHGACGRSRSAVVLRQQQHKMMMNINRSVDATYLKHEAKQ